MVKWLAARTSLQANITDHILTPKQLFQWADTNIKGIKFFYVPKEQVEGKRDAQEAHFRGARKVPGIRSHHSFIPTTTGQLKIMYHISADTTGTLVQDTQEHSDMQQYIPGKYIACVYDQKWYVGSIVECDEEEQDVLVSFMAQVGTSRSFKWPRCDDKCWVPLTHILVGLPVPTTTSTGRQYQFDKELLQMVQERFQRFSDVHF